LIGGDAQRLESGDGSSQCFYLRLSGLGMEYLSLGPYALDDCPPFLLGEVSRMEDVDHFPRAREPSIVTNPGELNRARTPLARAPTSSPNFSCERILVLSFCLTIDGTSAAKNSSHNRVPGVRRLLPSERGYVG